MRSPHALVILISLLMMACMPVRAEESSPGSVSEAMKQTTQPLLKALSMIGTPYRFGGAKPEKGMDCSGFVRHVYKESNELTLPRTARDMSREGEEVAESDLRPGDLVFFNTLRKPFSHVGIYAGNGEFVHASSRSTKQVTVSRMSDKYWSTRFNGARRVLPSP
ncbi:MAG: C40 family peptidase [Thiobacillus sp.]|nr:C40 family peptidase [Thiobacillus sp.]